MNTLQPLCRACGQPILGSYLRALGSLWHPEHFVCAACGQPIQGTSFAVQQNAPYHPDCYARQVAPHCVYCGRPLIGQYLIDHWGQKFCADHQGQFPHCAYCGRMVAPQQREPGADIIRCPVCRQHAVETVIEARPLFSHVVRWLNAQGLLFNNLHLSLELCDRAHLNGLLQGHNQAHSLGATTSATYMQNGLVLRSEVSGVAVLQGLPAVLFQGVTVHELGHVWLIVNEVRGLPSWAEEGFCELLSYRYYQDLRSEEGRYYYVSKEQNPDPIYGEGFRRLRDLSMSLGFPRLIDVLRTTKRLPDSHPRPF